MPDSVTGRRRRWIVLGIGNPDRGDDAAGRAVVRLLRGAPPDGVEIVEQDGEATALLAQLDGAAAAFVVDACASGAPAGAVQRFDVGRGPLPRAAFGLSTHGFGLAEAIELARALGQLPQKCVVYAIEGGRFEAGAPLSPPVAAAVVALAEQLRAEIGADARPGEEQHA
jgi:hydrogenase maturation protease